MSNSFVIRTLFSRILVFSRTVFFSRFQWPVLHAGYPARHLGQSPTFVSGASQSSRGIQGPLGGGPRPSRQARRSPREAAETPQVNWEYLIRIKLCVSVYLFHYWIDQQTLLTWNLREHFYTSHLKTVIYYLRHSNDNYRL